MKCVALHNLGCKVNGYEVDVIRQMLQQKGYEIVPFDEKADIYIINTCTVTNIADRKSRQMLHRAKKLNPEAVVVAVGCYVQTASEEALKDKSIDLAIGNNRKKDLVELLEEYLSVRESKTLSGKAIIDISHTNEYESMMLTRTGEHTRAFIKIQDGCNQFCAYCIIPFARGRVRSRSKQEIIKELTGLAANGCKEIVLTGIHISSYGTDFENANGKELLNLLSEIHGIEGLERIRLGSIEPRIITEEFAEGLAAMPQICPHFHLSLQSGCDDTLKRMNRRYTAGEYLEKVRILRKVFENPAITTDVIVGFPGETEEEFDITKDFLQKVGFYEMHIFKYSKRQGTKAAVMDNQVSEETKAKRSSELISLEQKLSKEYRKQFLHQKAAVLFEEEKMIDGEIYQIGYSREYIKTAVKMQENLSGKIMSGECTSLLKDDILLFKPQIH